MDSVPSLTLCDPLDYSPVFSVLRFSRQEYWSGWPFPSPGDLPDPGIKPASPGGPFTIVILLVTHKYQTQEHKEHFLPWDCFPLLETHAIWISEKTPVLFQTQIRVFMKSLLTGLASSQTSFSHLITFVRSILFIYTYTLSMQNSLWVTTNM